MKTKALAYAMSMVAFTFCANRMSAQQPSPTEELPKYEVGVDFTTFTRLDHPRETNAGVGARFTYNLNRHLALEGAGYFSPGNCRFCGVELTGKITEGLFGVKAGQRFKRFGVFGKVRPGVMNFSEGSYDFVPTGDSHPVFPFFGGGEGPLKLLIQSRTDFVVDVGPVLEIYPTKKVFLRFDGGYLVDHMGSRTIHSLNVDFSTGGFTPVTFTSPSTNVGRFQFTAGVGFRF